MYKTWPRIPEITEIGNLIHIMLKLFNRADGAERAHERETQHRERYIEMIMSIDRGNKGRFYCQLCNRYRQSCYGCSWLARRPIFTDMTRAHYCCGHDHQTIARVYYLAGHKLLAINVAKIKALSYDHLEKLYKLLNWERIRNYQINENTYKFYVSLLCRIDCLHSGRDYAKIRRKYNNNTDPLKRISMTLTYKRTAKNKNTKVALPN